VIQAAIPRAKADDVDVTIIGNTLTIRGEAGSETEVEVEVEELPYEGAQVWRTQPYLRSLIRD
jgi:HSP20 family molecular chaperone IbpA